MVTTEKPTIVERGSREGAYGITSQWAIIDHPRHGRLLVTDGFGGTDSLSGGTYRWRHGLVNKLLADDTFEALRIGEWNRVSSHLDAVVNGADKSRPVQEWHGNQIEALVRSLGL